MPLHCRNCGVKNDEDATSCSICGGEVYVPSGNYLAPGSIVGNRYAIISLIKAGGMGAVYKANDGRLDRICAVKEMFSNFDDMEEQKYAIKRFKSEAKILSKLQHDHLPVVYDYFVENGVYYLVMSFIAGEDLDTILEREGNPYLPEDKVVELAKQILSVLDYLHNQKQPIIYRDIKPGNIMVRESDGRAMLIDFGIARVLNPEQKVSKTAIGTDGYAPKEQYKGFVEPRSDLYALGATMHHLLTGEVPVPLDFEPVSVYNQNISLMLDDIIMKSLEKEVYNRFDTAKDMLEALNTYKDVKKVSAPSSVNDDIFDLQIDEDGEMSEETTDDLYDLEIEDDNSSGILPPIEDDEHEEGVFQGLLEWTGEEDPAAMSKIEDDVAVDYYDKTALEQFEKDFENQIKLQDASGQGSEKNSLNIGASQKKPSSPARKPFQPKQKQDTSRKDGGEEIKRRILHTKEKARQEEKGIYDEDFIEEEIQEDSSNEEEIQENPAIEEEIENNSSVREEIIIEERKITPVIKIAEEKKTTRQEEEIEDKIISITPRKKLNEQIEESIEKQKSLNALLKPFGSNFPSSIVHPKDEAEMIYIPAGRFIMGSNYPEDDNPENEVYLYHYYIDKYPVTNFRYNMFLHQTGHRPPANWNYSPQTADHPVTGVTWLDAKSYADWADKRLPTEAEWEKAARGTDGRSYPWGDDWDKNKCNNWNMDDPDLVEKMLDICNERGTMPAGCYPTGASPYGILDMAGNVAEWCADWYISPSQAEAFKGKEKIVKSFKACKGGSWRDIIVEAFRISSRRKSLYDKCYDAIGFRCCQTARNLTNK